jgi:hypothetical protein
MGSLFSRHNKDNVMQLTDVNKKKRLRLVINRDVRHCFQTPDSLWTLSPNAVKFIYYTPSQHRRDYNVED